MANTLLWWLSGNRLGLSRTGRSAPLFPACLSLASRARDRQELVESLRMGVRLPTVFSPAPAARECFSGRDCGGGQLAEVGEEYLAPPLLKLKLAAAHEQLSPTEVCPATINVQPVVVTCEII